MRFWGERVMRNDLVSIIVPVFNSEPYLSRCIESILAQTYLALEIILVDDGSTDNSGRICDEYSDKDLRIKVVHKDNGGQQDARTKGIAIAQGTYIGFVDSDDWIDKDMYENLMDEVEDFDLVTTGIWRHDKTGNMIETWMDLLPEGIYTKKRDLERLYENLIVYSKYNSGAVIGGISNNLYCKLFKASIVKEIYQKANIFIRNGEDFLFCLLYELKCKSIKITRNCYYHYIDNNESVSYNANLNYLKEQNDFYLAVDEALKGHWMEESLRHQLQRRLMYSVYVGMKKYMKFDEEIGFPTYAYPYGNELDGKKIVLFGAGKVGRSFYRDIENSTALRVVLWIDNYPTDVPCMGTKIEFPEKLLETDYDYVVCAVLKEGQANNMKSQLIGLGIEESRILWKEPITPPIEIFLKKK